MKIKDIWYYIQGNIRYKMFYNPNLMGLIRKHIFEQIIARIESMDQICYNDGQCKICGCATTALQMCDKACDKPCYPAMLTKKEWKIAKNIGVYVDENDNVWGVKEDDGVYKFKLYITE